MIDTGTNEGLARRAVEIINHYKLSSMCFVDRPRCGDVEPMMYWLTDAGLVRCALMCAVRSTQHGRRSSRRAACGADARP